MRRLGTIGLSVLLLVVLADWSSVWICVHPQACGDQRHDESLSRVHAHDHGPFQRSQSEGPGRVEHAAKLFGVCYSSRDVDIVLPQSKRIVFAFELTAFVPRVAAVAPVGERCPRLLADSRSSGKATILMTERWLV